jgi:hypothetical protein
MYMVGCAVACGPHGLAQGKPLGSYGQVNTVHPLTLAWNLSQLLHVFFHDCSKIFSTTATTCLSHTLAEYCLLGELLEKASEPSRGS